MMTMDNDPRHYAAHAGDDDAHHYSIERVAAVGMFPDHKQDVSFVDGDAIGLPLIEHTVRPGDVLRFHWWTHRHAGRPRAVSINGGPWVPYDDEGDDHATGRDDVAPADRR